MRSKTFWLFAMLVASLVLVAAGCGGDDDDGGDAAGTGTTEGGTEAAEQVITVNWGAEPPSLDPGLATDTTSSNILLNIMDPLVKLDEESLEPVPTAAESIERSDDGLTVTFTLRDDLAWTNGDPVTAEDFEYSWKRTVSPELGADYAYQFYGIVGAQEYNGCEGNKAACDKLADQMGVNAVDDKTLEVKLTTPQPWFEQQVAHPSFLAVHRATVEQYGDRSTEPAEHRHERAVHPRGVAAQLPDQHRQVARVARRGLRQADARQRPHDHRRHDLRAGVRGRRDRRSFPGPAAG